MEEQTCRECGCTDSHACMDEELGPCWWVYPDLCSHCHAGRPEKVCERPRWTIVEELPA